MVVPRRIAIYLLFSIIRRGGSLFEISYCDGGDLERVTGNLRKHAPVLQELTIVEVVAINSSIHAIL